MLVTLHGKAHYVRRVLDTLIIVTSLFRPPPLVGDFPSPPIRIGDLSRIFDFAEIPA